MVEKPNHFYKVLKTEVPINITPELEETFDSVKKALSEDCDLALKQPIPGKQLAFVKDASFRRDEYAFMIQDKPELKVTEKIRLKIREDIQTTPIELTTSPSDVNDGEQFFFTQADNKDESNKQTFQRKEQPRQKAKQWLANEEPSSLTTSVKEVTKIDGKTTSYSMNGIKVNT